MTRNRLLFVLTLSLLISLNVFSQDGQLKEVVLPGGTIETEKTFTYPGGKDSFIKDISDKFVLPRQAKKDKVSGKIVLKIQIDTLGVASGEIIKGIRPDVDSAAVNMVKSLKKSKPAEQSNKKVKTTLMVPINI